MPNEAAFNAYTPDSQILVYYDPDDPESAVLKTGTGFGTYVPLVLGGFSP
ncbi:MAG: hypothetical protein R3C44_03960 [Chloroflexota bacterium]